MHDLQRFGPAEFQQLAAALANAAFGTHVTALGSGPDGGRDMICQGRLSWDRIDAGDGEVWDGYTIFQVKHKEHLREPRANAEWLWGQIRGELDLWADGPLNRQRMPDYILFVTNVPLTPDPQSGTLALIEKNVASYVARLEDTKRDMDAEATNKRISRLRRLRRIRRWRVWDGNQVSTLINVHQAVRRGFTSLLTAGDVLSSLAEISSYLTQDQLEPGLVRHARASLVADRTLHFDEAGYNGGGMPLEAIAIDLPLASPDHGNRNTIFKYVFERAELVLRPNLELYNGPPHVVLSGGPGNGKSTVSKFIVQAYRASFLEHSSQLSTEHRLAIEGTANAMKRFGISDLRGLPRNRRWPMRVDLAIYVEEHGLEQDSTLLHWIAHKISAKSNVGSVTPNLLLRWMTLWPWLLVLDGLDEVSEPTTRKRLIGQIEEFVTEAAADNQDGFVLLTTRPTGFVERIAPTLFTRVDLGHMTLPQAVSYGTRVTQVRLSGDEDKVDHVIRQLRRASDDEALRYLMRTPLQVLIMTIIVEGAGRLAPDRYSLFWGYYETVLRRERTKLGHYSSLLQDYGAHILELHQRVGFELQVATESTDLTASVLSVADLKAAAWRVLQNAGFRPSDKDANLLERIVQACTHRLVLLAPRGDDGLGFDVRSLQELMAARYITTGREDEVFDRLSIAAASPHWRNTWLFAAGRFFAEPQPHLHERLIGLVEGVDDHANHRLSQTFPMAPGLALDLLADGMTRAHPIFRGRLVEVAMKTLSDPGSIVDYRGFAGVLVQVAEVGERLRIRDSLRAALIRGDASGLRASQTVVAIAEYTEHSYVSHDVGLMGRISVPDSKVRSQRVPPSEPYPMAAALNVEETAILNRVLSAIREIQRSPVPNDLFLEVVKGLRDPAVALAIDDEFSRRPQDHGGEIAALRSTFLSNVLRSPVGDLLTQAAPPRDSTPG